MHEPEPKRRMNRFGINYFVELIFDDGLKALGLVADESADGVGLDMTRDTPVEEGSAVVVVSETQQRSGVVQHVSRSGNRSRLGIQLRSAYYRECARNLVGTAPSSQFACTLPSVLYSLWQLFDSNESHILVNAVEQLVRIARQHGIELDAATPFLEASSQPAGPQGRNALTNLCQQCLTEAARLPQESQPAVQQMPSNVPSKTSNAMQISGVPIWVLGTVACLACRLAITT